MQDAEPVSLNAINVQPMPFAGSSNVLPWKYDDDNPAIDDPQVEIQEVKVLRINTKKFTSDELAAFGDLPQAIPILESNIPTVEEPILIDVKAVAVDPADACDDNNVRA